MLGQFAVQLDDIQQDLKVQFTRIAQLQADLDHLRASFVKKPGG